MALPLPQPEREPERPGVRWVRGRSGGGRAGLARWRAAVGAPLLAPAAAPLPPPARGAAGLALVAWNVAVGAGDLARLVADLRAGDLTGGRPVSHFVLLLQEAVRVGGSVPAGLAEGAIAPRAIGAPVRPARGIEAVAAAAGLHAFYAPSMRNGPGHREDRGNAILSTLPLEAPTAIELPHERQRRVAIAARVAVPTGAGGCEPLRVVSLHFDHASTLPRLWRSFGAARARQARALLAALDGDEATVLGGDFNTWFGGSREAALALLRPHFPWPRALPADGTLAAPFGLPPRRVDYLMGRLPPGWRARYRVARDRRGSDHAPLVGWIDLPRAGAVRGPR